MASYVVRFLNIALLQAQYFPLLLVSTLYQPQSISHDLPTVRARLHLSSRKSDRAIGVWLGWDWGGRRVNCHEFDTPPFVQMSSMGARQERRVICSHEACAL